MPEFTWMPKVRPMNEAHRVTARKIDPTKGTTLPDGTLNDNDRIEIGPHAAGLCRVGGGRA